MKTARLLIAVSALLTLSTVDVGAQSFLDRLGKRVQQRAEESVIRKAEEATDKVIDKATDADTYRGDGKDAQQQQPAQQAEAPATASAPAATEAQAPAATPQQSLEMTYAKSDFVAGDEIIFEDLLVGEKLGEFPSMWDLKEGNAEVASVGGENAIHMERETLIMPFMKEKDYLPDVFTVEFDLYVPCRKENGGKDNCQINNRYDIGLVNAAGKVVFEMWWYNSSNDWGKQSNIDWEWLNGGERSDGEAEYMFKLSDFNHIAISFNKRALKFYINGIRVVNIPRCDAPTRFQIFSYQGEAKDERFIKNIRIAQGAVPLYDRMMSDGKFITYGITFDVGKSTIKPESMGEINRIVQLLNENPELKFSVEGHTDSTGNAASNQTLSDARSAAVVAKLVELGIAADRLTSAGKGQNSPIADNSTDEGRAKNRRVEFVKQ
jgi:outer membrane protein OmpA-like peptidoglycan-associated protein